MRSSPSSVTVKGAAGATVDDERPAGGLVRRQRLDTDEDVHHAVAVPVGAAGERVAEHVGVAESRRVLHEAQVERAPAIERQPRAQLPGERLQDRHHRAAGRRHRAAEQPAPEAELGGERRQVEREQRRGDDGTGDVVVERHADGAEPGHALRDFGQPRQQALEVVDDARRQHGAQRQFAAEEASAAARRRAVEPAPVQRLEPADAQDLEQVARVAGARGIEVDGEHDQHLGEVGRRGAPLQREAGPLEVQAGDAGPARHQRVEVGGGGGEIAAPDRELRQAQTRRRVVEVGVREFAVGGPGGVAVAVGHQQIGLEQVAPRAGRRHVSGAREPLLRGSRVTHRQRGIGELERERRRRQPRVARPAAGRRPVRAPRRRAAAGRARRIVQRRLVDVLRQDLPGEFAPTQLAGQQREHREQGAFRRRCHRHPRGGIELPRAAVGDGHRGVADERRQARHHRRDRGLGEVVLERRPRRQHQRALPAQHARELQLVAHLGVVGCQRRRVLVGGDRDVDRGDRDGVALRVGGGRRRQAGLIPHRPSADRLEQRRAGRAHAFARGRAVAFAGLDGAERRPGHRRDQQCTEAAGEQRAPLAAHELAEAAQRSDRPRVDRLQLEQAAQVVAERAAVGIAVARFGLHRVREDRLEVARRVRGDAGAAAARGPWRCGRAARSSCAPRTASPASGTRTG
ncbi:MAG: hypothetical protein U1E73_07590 [Planctomycetota bacterium]